MTALLDLTRLREIAQITEDPGVSPGRVVPRLAWTVDTQTGRPSAQWVLGEKDAPRD